LGNYPRIGIMVAKKSFRKRILQLYQKYCPEDLGLQLCAFTPDAVSVKKRTVTVLLPTKNGWKEKTVSPPAVVYNCYYNKTAKEINLFKIMGKDKIFNTVTFFNKWRVSSFLAQSEYSSYLPETFMYKSSLLPDYLEAWKLLFLKPVYGNKGRHVYRLEQKENSEIYISTHSLPPRYICRQNEDSRQKLQNVLPSKKYIMQRGIESSKLDNCFFDLRFLVQKNISGNWQVSVAACRLAYESYFNTSAFQGIYVAENFLPKIKGQAGTFLLEQLKEISIGVAKVLDRRLGLLGELSVDFILDENNRPWIIEVNGKPQKSIYKDLEAIPQKQLIFQKPLEYAYYLSQLSST